MRIVCLATTLFCLASTAVAAAANSCGRYDFAGPYAEAFLAGRTFPQAKKASEAILTLPDAVCHQRELLERLDDALGERVGYKAAATSEGAQRQLGLDGPVLGVLFADMLREDGAEIALDEGARMIFELDLLARVGDASINEATTRAEALAAIDAFLPFVELGDLMLPKGAAINGALLQAMNAGARLGVMGAPVPSEGMSEATLEAVAGRLSKDGSLVAEAPATALYGHPLEAVLWIVDAVRARGERLEPGDVLSLGSMGRFQLASSGSIEAAYEGLGEDGATVSLTLR